MTDISRRGLIGAGAAGAAGALVGVLAPGPAASAAAATRKLYTRSRFTRLRGAKFRLTSPTSTTAVPLTHVSDLPSALAGDSGCLGLTLRSATAGPPQGTYTLRRPGFTATKLFAVPSDPSRRTDHVVVNRAG